MTTTTVSEAQRRLATDRVARAGLDGRVRVLGDDYRELGSRYDALVSIEIVEAVDWTELGTFMAQCRRLVADGGRVSLQAIVLDDASEPRARWHDDFIRALVFPGSCIPAASRLLTRAAKAGLRTIDPKDIGRHCAETLRRWRANLAGALRPGGSATADTAGRVAEVGAERLRTWELYLAYGEAAFLERHISGVQMVLAPGGWRDQMRPGRLASVGR